MKGLTLASQPTYHTLNEITQQPMAWEGALRELERQNLALHSLFQLHPTKQLLYVGCGSPYFLARSAASLSRALTGIDAQAHPGSNVWLFTAQTLVQAQDNLFVAISRSGETTEVMKAIEAYRAHGGAASSPSPATTPP
jgi:glucosamine--fructose-6-phosphate aminotransferase (isomerizing)